MSQENKTRYQSTFKINQNNAIILNLPSVEKKAVTNSSSSEIPKFNFADKVSCFFSVIDCLYPTEKTKNNPLLISTDMIRERMQQIFEQYKACSNILAVIINMPGASTLSSYKAVNINDKPLQDGIKKNLLSNIKNNPGIAKILDNNENICDRYIDDFIEYYRETDPLKEQNPLSWMRLAQQHLTNMIPAILEQISSEFLEKMGISTADALSEAAYKHRTKSEKSQIIFSFFLRKIADQFGFKTDSQWNPQADFSVLMDMIKTRGYLICGGLFGRSFYTADPIEKKIGNLTVLAWKANTFKTNQNQKLAHEIIILGASCAGYETTTQDLIYFIDPSKNDAIYMMSYKNFCDRIGTTHGTIKSSNSRNSENDNNNNYFFTHPNLKPASKALSVPKTVPIPKTTLAYHPQTSFWKNLNCNWSTASKVAIAASVTAAVGVAYALSNSM